MSTFTKQKLSGCTDGKPVLIVATTTPGTLIHTAIAGTINFDEVWLWLVNNGVSDVLATVEYGDATATGNISYTVAAKDGLKCVLPGLVLQNGATVKVFAGTGSVVSAFGFVNQIIA